MKEVVKDFSLNQSVLIWNFWKEENYRGEEMRLEKGVSKVFVDDKLKNILRLIEKWKHLTVLNGNQRHIVSKWRKSISTSLFLSYIYI